MSTYNSYAEAKITNPESDIYHLNNIEFVRDDTTVRAGDWKKCDPADYCITVEKFLADGHKFVDGDLFLNSENDDVEIGKTYENGIEITTHEANEKCKSVDDQCYVLRAAALIQPEPQF